MTPREKIDQSILPLCELLKKQGYKKNGRNFSKLNGERGSAISVIASRFNSGHSVTFGISLGVLIPEIPFSLNGEFPKKLTRADQCSWVTDIGFLLPEKNQKTWEVGLVSNIELVSDEVVKLVSNLALPWLSSNINLEEFLSWLSTQPGTMAAELLLEFNRTKEARGCIDISIQEYIHRSKQFPEMFTSEFIAGQKENLQKWLDKHDL